MKTLIDPTAAEKIEAEAIRALADDPAVVAQIIEQVKGESDEMGTR